MILTVILGTLGWIIEATIGMLCGKDPSKL